MNHPVTTILLSGVISSPRDPIVEIGQYHVGRTIGIKADDLLGRAVGRRVSGNDLSVRLDEDIFNVIGGVGNKAEIEGTIRIKTRQVLKLDLLPVGRISGRNIEAPAHDDLAVRLDLDIADRGKMPVIAG